MMATSTLTSKEQITIPKEIRRQVQLRIGQKVRFDVDSRGRVILTPQVHDGLSLDGGFPACTGADGRAVKDPLAGNPEAGALIPGSGGVRKLRWALPGRGKRSGLRVIYYVRTRQGVIWMLTLYAKNEAANIPAHILRKIPQEIKEDA